MLKVLGPRRPGPPRAAQDVVILKFVRFGDASSSTSVPDVTTVTIFGKKREAGDITRAQIDTHTSSSCGFMNDRDPNNEDIVQDYLRDFGEDQNGSNQTPGTDQSDLNAAGNSFKDNSPFGDSSQDNAANTNTLSTMQVGQGGVPKQATGACGPSDKAFAAGRNYIARTDTSLKDAFAAFDARDYPKAVVDLFKKSYDKMGYDQAALMEGKMLLAGMGALSERRPGGRLAEEGRRSQASTRARTCRHSMSTTRPI